MAYKNHQHMKIQDLRSAFDRYVDTLGSFSDQAESPEVQQLETALANTNNANFKIIHPLLINRYKFPTIKYRFEPLQCVGLDIETNAGNGQPMLLGFWHGDTKTGSDEQAFGTSYDYVYKPTIRTFFEVIRGYAENTPYSNFVTWGNLDIQCILRLFKPTETERQRISAGLSADVRNGKFSATPPILRKVGKADFYVAHYIPGRSIKLGYLENGFNKTVWIFNCSQFYPGRIGNTAKALNLDWQEFDRSTHLIDWKRFESDNTYQDLCIQSNRQDARIVTELAENLQDRFNEVFDAYPQLLVSTGSLTDAAVSRMLGEHKPDYQSNSWRWLVSNTWKSNTRTEIAQAETLVCECFSAGYVDQFAVGYFDSVCTADIAAAYPHKIRQLPDLRYSQLFVGRGNLEWDLKSVDLDIETAIIRGRVEIPDTLKFHPITVKTYARENHRPTGTFYATYTLEERRFCEKYGATFKDEEYVIVGLTERRQAPIGRVSEELGEFRNRLLAEMKSESGDKKRMLDGQQYLIKVVDNSIYGKTVMTTEVVEDIGDRPQITGYIAGDRFNMLYGTLITARTRIQIAEACMKIVEAGGRPIMTMTDSIYWQGSPEMLPGEMVRRDKTPGYFESPETVHHMFILKTGQYEYEKSGEWEYKMRGLNVDRDRQTGKGSFYRRIIKQKCSGMSPFTHPEDIQVRISTRRLISIGAHKLDLLGAVVEGETDMQPFIMSSKQTERFVTDWAKCLDGHVWLKTPHLDRSSPDKSAAWWPLIFMRRLFEQGINAVVQVRKSWSAATSGKLRQRKQWFVWNATLITQKIAPPGRITDHSWPVLETWYGIKRENISWPNGISAAQ